MESGADFLDFQKSYKQAAGDKINCYFLIFG